MAYTVTQLQLQTEGWYIYSMLLCSIRTRITMCLNFKEIRYKRYVNALTTTLNKLPDEANTHKSLSSHNNAISSNKMY